mgnify:FL=1
MELDSHPYNTTASGMQLATYTDAQIEDNPRISLRGYCPILNRKALGRYKYYEVALTGPCDFIVRYRDLDKYGYAESSANYMQKHYSHVANLRKAHPGG